MPSQPENPREESPSSHFDSVLTMERGLRRRYLGVQVLDAWRMACGGGLARGDVRR
ncbi:hypothetical protein ERO13_A03G028051v2 [Gossypium hirsutum]|uniref:Uncharacterized protein n=1 Tax=Gossypium tomentosum TaxID=34277 RepID=A0A5D2R526_GOSTO|nr:hypothetical protein ERO13_A03G028051v2 [Gossypium hirsutum]TYI34905.1 hypothetical protein ES332_A03G040500v1 [Gossypium tomentosum]